MLDLPDNSYLWKSPTREVTGSFHLTFLSCPEKVLSFPPSSSVMLYDSASCGGATFRTHFFLTIPLSDAFRASVFLRKTRPYRRAAVADCYAAGSRFTPLHPQRGIADLRSAGLVSCGSPNDFLYAPPPSRSISEACRAYKPCLSMSLSGRHLKNIHNGKRKAVHVCTAFTVFRRASSWITLHKKGGHP